MEACAWCRSRECSESSESRAKDRFQAADHPGRLHRDDRSAHWIDSVAAPCLAPVPSFPDDEFVHSSRLLFGMAHHDDELVRLVRMRRLKEAGREIHVAWLARDHYRASIDVGLAESRCAMQLVGVPAGNLHYQVMTLLERPGASYSDYPSLSELRLLARGASCFPSQSAHLWGALAAANLRLLSAGLPLRAVSDYDYTTRPHPGRLNYEGLEWYIALTRAVPVVGDIFVPPDGPSFSDFVTAYSAASGRSSD